VANSLAPLAAGLGEQFRVFGLTPGTQYYFAVRAVDDAGNKGAVTRDAIALTAAADTRAPDPTVDLTAK
jgi:hypothetical protein